MPTEEIQPEVSNVGEELDESIFTGGRERQHLSRSQIWEGRKEYRSEGCPEPSEVISVTVSAELKSLQETDRTLQVIRRAVAKKESENGINLVMKEGLIYRVVRAPFGWDSPNSEGGGRGGNIPGPRPQWGPGL